MVWIPISVKQKIVIVRSLVGNPRVILFDDSNANFDVKNDQKLIELIEELKGERTMIVVSHRPSLLRVCDRNFELVNGQLVTAPVAAAPTQAVPVETQLWAKGA